MRNIPKTLDRHSCQMREDGKGIDNAKIKKNKTTASLEGTGKVHLLIDSKKKI